MKRMFLLKEFKEEMVVSFKYIKDVTIEEKESSVAEIKDALKGLPKENFITSITDVKGAHLLQKLLTKTALKGKNPHAWFAEGGEGEHIVRGSHVRCHLKGSLNKGDDIFIITFKGKGKSLTPIVKKIVVDYDFTDEWYADFGDDRDYDDCDYDECDYEYEYGGVECDELDNAYFAFKDGFLSKEEFIEAVMAS